MNVVECCGKNCSDAAKYLICWRPRRDLNPCYRRERAFRGTLGYFVQSCRSVHNPNIGVGLRVISTVALFASISTHVHVLSSPQCPQSIATVNRVGSLLLESAPVERYRDAG
jgi:hypothetical protein